MTKPHTKPKPVPEPEAPSPPRPRWASPRGTAAHLSVSLRTVTGMVAEGKIPAYRFGKKLIRIDLNEVDAMMQPITNGGESA